MTAAEIMALPAGRELDGLVAEHVLGWTDVKAECYTPTGKDWCGTPPPGGPNPWQTGRAYVPRFSTRIEDAWRAVVAYQQRRSPGSHLGIFPSLALSCAAVEICRPYKDWQPDHEDCAPAGALALVVAETVERAICRAVLLGLLTPVPAQEGVTS